MWFQASTNTDFIALDFLSMVLYLWLKATVLEEMPPFPERESSILAILKKKKPGRVTDGEVVKEHKIPAAIVNSSATHTDHMPQQVIYLRPFN